MFNSVKLPPPPPITFAYCPTMSNIVNKLLYQLRFSVTEEMESATLVRNLYKAVCVSHHANTLA